jgi:hypothetical protein
VIAVNHLRKGGKYRPVPVGFGFWQPQDHGVFLSLLHLLTGHLHRGYPGGFCIV